MTEKTITLHDHNNVVCTLNLKISRIESEKEILREVADGALKIAESWIVDKLEGTKQLEGALKQVRDLKVKARDLK